MKIILLILAFCISACSNTKKDQKPFSYSIYSITQINNLTRDFKEGDIDVSGYFSIDGNLYLTRDHAEIFDGSNSVNVILPIDEKNYKIFEPCYNSYVSITGKLRRHHQHGLPYIGNVERLYTTPPMSENKKSVECYPENK